MCLYMYVSMFMYIKKPKKFLSFELYVKNQYKQECKNFKKKTRLSTDNHL